MLTPGPGPGPVNILPRLSHHALCSLQRHEIASEGKYRGLNRTARIKRPPVGRPILLWALAINPDNSTCVFPVQKEVVKVMNKRKSFDLRRHLLLVLLSYPHSQQLFFGRCYARGIVLVGQKGGHIG